MSEHLINNDDELVLPPAPLDEPPTESVAEAETPTEEEEADDSTVEHLIASSGSAHDDFDWSRGKLDQRTYSDQERRAMLEQYDETLNAVQEFEIVKGTVSRISGNDVMLDLRYKSDGLLTVSDFRDRPDLKVGDQIEVYLESQEDKNGQLVLSRRKAKLLRAWQNIKDSFEKGTIIEGVIIGKTKGGLIADVDGLETFLPGSQIDIKSVTDYDSYIGKKMEFKVVKINEQIKNAVVSHKILIESDLETQRQEIIASLERGQVLEGSVKNITDFGAFLDLGGVDGLLYITDISWGRISHPTELLQLGQKLNVVVLDFDDSKKRISLGLKQLTPHPWEVLPEHLQEGSEVEGRIVNIEDYGAFLEIIPGVEGLIHVSEVAWSNTPIQSREYFKLHTIHRAKIVTIDREDRKISLSIKQLTPDPWGTIDAKYPVNSRHTCEVKNLTPYGVFVELEEGIGGMVHISDLSWTKRYNHPSEFTRVGEKIDVMILEVDRDNRKLSLGVKQLEENPWDTFEKVFPVGSFHEATVLKRDDRGAVVLLPYGLEAFAPGRHIRKEDNTLPEVDETMMVKVIEFNRDDKRIVVSHMRFLEDQKRNAEEAERKLRAAEREAARADVKKQQDKIQKTTLGEMSDFAALRKQLEMEEEAGDENKPE